VQRGLRSRVAARLGAREQQPVAALAGAAPAVDGEGRLPDALAEVAGGG
jgi:hypothetical protein